MNPRLATVQLRTDQGEFIGTGFFVDVSRIVTCRHVIERNIDSNGVLKVRVHWLGEQRIPVSFSFHESRDAASLVLAQPFSMEPTILLWSRFTASEGRRVVISGFSKPEVYELEQLVRFIRGYSSDYDLCVVDHPVEQGFSGSPAILNDLVVGLTVAADPNRTLLIPVTALASFQPVQNAGL